MNSTLKSWMLAVTAFGALLPAVMAQAQTQDYPTHQGSNLRQGNNGNPVGDNPGLANIRWFFPSALNSTFQTILRDNGSTEASHTANFVAPALGNEASGFFQALPTGNLGQDALNGVGGAAYLYAPTIPSAPGNDPRIPAGGSTLDTFTWRFTPPTNAQNDYALFIWVPVGPTIANDNVTNLFPPQFFVYEVDYGTNQSIVLTIDQTQVRGGFVRLGGTQALFHYDGVTPIKVTLFNTIPRDPVTGQLLGVFVNPVTGQPNPYVVYADAAKLTSNNGDVTATPVQGTTTAGITQLFGAVNQEVLTTINGQSQAQQRGTLNTFKFDDGTLNWSFTPLSASSGSGVIVDDNSASVAVDPGWFLGNAASIPGFTGFTGSGFRYQPITNNPGTAQQVSYSPNLATGDYDVLLWLPGAAPAGQFGTAVTVELDEGAVKTLIAVDLTQTNGYVRVGGRRFTNSPANPLVVKITNLSSNPADLGKTAYADAVKFVGSAALAINSSPIFATVNLKGKDAAGNPLGTKSVVIVAAEDGKLYCLDATGRGDGTTDVYWTYPTTLDPNNPAATDPNNNSPTEPGLDGALGVTEAEMPTGFDTSSGLIQEVPVGSGNFFLYIGSNNGRVYCIDMSGRGDLNLVSRTPGTTTRIWSFPNDYPNAFPEQSQLGTITGALSYRTNLAGPTIFVPTLQGRMYALDAVGDAVNKITTRRWVYPALNVATLGPIAGTPAIDNNPAALYFGTARKNGVSPGQFLSLDAETGALRWTVNADNQATPVPFDTFVGGAATAFNNVVGDGKNYIYAGNQNGYVYAFDDTGAILWETNELNSTVSAPLMFTEVNAFNNAGTQAGAVPVVMVPTDNGIFYGLYAAQASVNTAGGKLAYGYQADGDQITAGMSNGHGFMYGGDNHGFLYAFTNSLAGVIGGLIPPGANIGVPNDPATQDFNQASIQFLQPAIYKQLRQDPAPAYSNYIKAANFLTLPQAFDFGETLYVLVYNFPSAGFGNFAGTPQINFTFTVEGRTYRAIPSPTRDFAPGTGAPTGPSGEELNGFTVLPFTLQAQGGNSLAPGNGIVSFTVGTINKNGVTTNYTLDPTKARLPFGIANPIGIAMKLQPNSNYGLAQDSLGASTKSFADPTQAENAFNGSTFTVIPTGLGGNIVPANLLTSYGSIGHGQTASQTIEVYDRSLMAIINGPDLGGLMGIRVDRADLAWQGGYNAVVKPFGGANGLYPGLLDTFEDYPVNFPNNSLDYSDIKRQDVLVTKDPLGIPENPTFNSVGLRMPFGLFVQINGVNTNQTVPPAQYRSRTPNPTPFEFDVAVPLYQPPNASGGTPDTLGNLVNAQYVGLMNVYVDSNSNGKLDLINGRREAFRSFNLGGNVDVDERLDVVTPGVDLGSLAAGTGIAPSAAVNSGSIYSPLVPGVQASLYQPFQALNEGNVNLLRVHIAHGYDQGGAVTPWPLYASINDDLGYLDGETYLWSSLDPVFSVTSTANGGPLARGEIFTPKSRVTERSGTRITTNPRHKQNAALGHSGGLNDTLTGALALDPVVGVTPPIGAPVGAYSQIVRVIEDRNFDNSLQQGVEAFSDPTFNLTFNVAETRLTNIFSVNPRHNGNPNATATAPMVDNLLVPNTPPPAFVDSNIEPTGMRDLFGGLTAAWSSNRPDQTTPVNASASSYGYRLYFGGLGGTAPLQANVSTTPLRDLAQFQPTNGNQWFKLMGPYPAGNSQTDAANVNALFGAAGADHIIGTVAGEPDTVRFDNPSFPEAGVVNPFNSATSFGSALVAFNGTGDKQSPAGRGAVNRLFVASVSPVSGGAPTLGAAHPLLSDQDVVKSKPAIVQFSDTTAVVFYGGLSGGQPRLSYTLFTSPNFSQSVPIETGYGFESVSDPSATARTYIGSDAATVAANGAMIELAFSGKLRGRSTSEIYMGRIPTDGSGAPNASNSSKSLVSFFSVRYGERLQADSKRGVYRTMGVDWNMVPDPTKPEGGAANAAMPFDILASLGAAPPVSILSGANNVPIVDQQAGIYQVQTTLGSVYVDRTLGTVRFAQTIPGANVNLFISYQPRFLRISTTTRSSLTQPSLMFDNRLVGSSNYLASSQMLDRYWYIGNNGTHSNLTDGTLRNTRYVFTYDRAAVAAGQTARPLMLTARLGIQLPTAIATLQNGDVDFSKISVTCKGNYQIDPTNGRIYFTQVDEDNIVSVTTFDTVNTYKVGLVLERGEAPILIEKAVNETSLSAFLDPFDPQRAADRRPGLIWLFWSSGRGGVSDVYFESIAPALYPIPVSH